MDRDKKNSVLAQLDIKDLHADMLLELKKETGTRIFGCTCPVIPPEIPAAFNILLLKIPEFVLASRSMTEKYSSVYDAVILPDCGGMCSRNPFPGLESYTFTLPGGWGEEASVAIHNSFEKMLRSLCGINIKEIDIEELKKRTAVYEALRRTVRGICSAKNEKPGLVNSIELAAVFETALIQPPEASLRLLQPLLDWMRNEKQAVTDTPRAVNAMLYGGRIFPGELACTIESLNINVAEDDSCAGRRCFDLSTNAESDYLFYELLDAYSYRPLTPCLRKGEERYELLYRLLRNHGIETVIFFEDRECDISPAHIDFLRVRMMRDGIDPLVITGENCVEKIKGYLEIF